MILVRDEFQCEPGRAREFVNRFRETIEAIGSQNVVKRARIMTDLTGRFDTVVVESEIESMDAYFDMLHAAFANPEFQARQAEANLMPYRSGTRTFYTIEASYEG